jgi:paraquat-inducible protein A
MKGEHLIACHDCDLLHRVSEVPEGMSAYCCRCGALLAQSKRNSVERTLALALAGLFLLILANSFPFLGFKIQGQSRHVLLLTGIRRFYISGMPWLALLVLFTTFIAPLLQILLLMYILLPLYLGVKSPGMFVLFRWVQKLGSWSMTEVFMVGVLVSIVKLAKMAQIIPDVALFCFMALIFVLAACMASLDPHQIWKQWKTY